MSDDKVDRTNRRDFLAGLSVVSACALIGSKAVAQRVAPTMNWGEWARCDAIALARLVKNGEVTAMQVAEQAQLAVDLINPRLNAVVEFYHDQLLPGASDSLPDGVFHGVPFFFKDVGDVEKGRVSAWGSRAWANRISTEDTEYIHRTRAMGLNFLGRTAAPEFGTSVVTESLLYGTTHNPWDVRYTPGGSSGGAAAAVAAGLTPIAAAGDGGGSTRIPSSMCNTVGLKHSRSIAVEISANPDKMSLVSRACITRSVRDTAAFLDAALAPGKANANPRMPGSHLASLRGPPRKLKIAVSSGIWGPYAAESDALAEMHRVGEVLQSLGHTVDEADAEIDFNDYFRAFRILWTASEAARVPPQQQEGRSRTLFADILDQTEPMTKKIFADGRKWTWDDYQWALSTYRKLTATLSGFFSDWDAWLTPTVAKHTPRIGSNLALSCAEQPLEQFWLDVLSVIPYTPLCNFLGNPAISVPVASFSSGMPLGAHFMAADLGEGTLLQLAAQLEEALPWADKHPAVHVTNAG